LSAKTEIKPEFLSVASDNPFIANISSPRAVMHMNHMSGHLPLLNPDSKLIKSGIEYEFGKYINQVVVEKNCIVKAIIPRYKEYGIEPPSFIVFVEYEENDKIYLDFIEVKTYDSQHTFFGYRLHPTDDLYNLTYNSPLSEGTVLSRTDSYGKDGDYKYGLNCNVAFMSHPSVSEDGFVVSESFIKRCKSSSIIKRVINITKDSIPVNLYGSRDVFKFIPDIGESVRQDGLLCALRPRQDWFSISDLNTRNISEPDFIFDNLVYVNPNSKVIDIKVIKTCQNKPEFTSAMTAQLDHYAEMLNNFYRNIVNKYEQLMAEKKALYGDTGIVSLTPRMHRFITDTMIKLNYANSNRHKLCYRKLPIDQYRIEITTYSEIVPSIGYKLTDQHAAKGVICRILPDEAMPTDKNGNRADIITDSAATISRMNLGRAYEAYLGSVLRDNRQKLIAYFSKYQNLDQVNKEDLTFFYNFMRGLFVLINSEMVEFIDSLNEVELINYLKEVITDNMYLYYPTDNEKNITDVIQDIENSPYKPLNDKVTYMDELGRMVETTENIRIGQLYIIMLEKIANTYSAVSSSKVNSFGFPIKGSSNEKIKYPHSLTPTKNAGETETRIFAAFGDPSLVADIFDNNLNTTTHKLIVKEILNSDQAFNNRIKIDRNSVPYGNTRSLAIFKHIFNASGLDYVYEESK
jgi:DNA-directed RNA polymerase beta subunit